VSSSVRLHRVNPWMPIARVGSRGESGLIAPSYRARPAQRLCMSSADSSRSPDTPTHGRENQRTRGRRSLRQSQESTVEPTELLSLLGDDHARNVLRVLAEGPRPAVEIVDELTISRPTVYRRLDSLESAGLVESSMRIREGGHHRKRFHLAVDSAEVGFDADGLTVEVNA